MSEDDLPAARIIADHRLARRPLPPLPLAVRPADESAAYAVQEELHALLTQAGAGPVAGHKIGCTTKVMQAFLGIHNPCGAGCSALRCTRARHASGMPDFCTWVWSAKS